MLVFFPFMVLLFLFFLVLLLVLFFLAKWGIIALAFSNIGVAPEILFLLLFLSMIGSTLNIPVWRMHRKQDPHELIFPPIVSFFGVRYRLPMPPRHHETVVAVNVGGAVIPTTLALYLWSHAPTFLPIAVATAIVTLITYKVARAVPGVGIAIPMFIPPIVAALCGMLLTPEWAPRTAYVSGTLGTLMGADILNLPKITNLRAPVVSIGGAGTFDGIFLTGIIAVLLA